MLNDKKLILNADDLGYSRERDLGIIKCFELGGISSASLLVNGVVADEAAQLIKQHNIPTGLHLNITEGKPLCQIADVSSLLDRNGFFLGKLGFRQAFQDGKVKLHEIKQEIQAQITEFQRLTAFIPTHVDGHQHIHVIPGICETFASVLKKNGIKATRLPLEDLDPHHPWQSDLQKKFMDEVTEHSYSAKSIFTQYGIWYADYFCGLQSMGSDMTLSQLEQQLKSAFSSESSTESKTDHCRQSVTCEMMVHPGYMTKEIGGCGDGPDEFSQSHDRENELNVLTDPQTLKLYQDLNLKLVSYKDCLLP